MSAVIDIDTFYEKIVQPLLPSQRLELLNRISEGLAQEEPAGPFAEWVRLNQRRGELLYQSVHGILNPHEEKELEHLQAQADVWQRRIAPRPVAELEELEQKLLRELSA